jgi:hypothetical protein
MTSGTTKSLEGVWGSSSADVYAVGSAGTILHYDGNAWNTVDDEYTGETLYSIWGNPPSDVYAVDAEPIILHYRE